jgi:nanoRNase/pAp phosphatase (c-di-AMP/oligoRNAs hydrolase)
MKAPLLAQIKEHDLSKTAIFTGAGVDPDGLASGLGMSMIVELLGGKATTFHRGTFNRPQNKTVRQILGLQIKPVSEFADDDDWTCVISVDGPAGVCPATPDYVVDHHEQSGDAKVGSDIRLQGSASSIIWEYAVEAGIDFTTEDGAKLAAAIAIGIITDTRVGGEESCSDLDYDALAFCLRHKDAKAYQDMLNYPLPAYYHDYYAIGWGKRDGSVGKVIERDVFVSGLGNIPAARSGVISDLAEKFAQTSGCTTALVFAFVEGKLMVSCRSSNMSLNVNEFIKELCGPDAGGGKRGAGAATIDLPVELPTLLTGLPDNLNGTLYQSIGDALVHKAMQLAGDGVREDEEEGVS